MNKPKLLCLLLLLAIVIACTPAPVANPTSPPLPASPPAPPSTTPVSLPPSSTLTVHFIDVGQGDSILIDLEDKEILIDGGEKSPRVVNYIKPYIDGKLEALVATHPHADHIGGLIEVLQKFDVMDIWTNGEKSTSQIYKELVNLANAENATMHIAKRGDSVQAGALNLLVLNPTQPLTLDTNNSSIVLNMRYGDVDFLFMGDAEKEAEAAMLVKSDIPVPDCNVLKVGHHGSNTASSQTFLSATKPETAIYMAGVGNTYGHPHNK